MAEEQATMPLQARIRSWAPTLEPAQQVSGVQAASVATLKSAKEAMTRRLAEMRTMELNEDIVRALALAEETDSDEPELAPVKTRKRKATRRKQKGAPAKSEVQDLAGDGSPASGLTVRNGLIDGPLSHLPILLPHLAIPLPYLAIAPWHIEAKQLVVTWVPADTRQALGIQQKYLVQHSTQTPRYPQRSSSARITIHSGDSAPTSTSRSSNQSSSSSQTSTGELRVIEHCLTVRRRKDIEKQRKERPGMSMAAPAKISRPLADKEQLGLWLRFVGIVQKQEHKREADSTVSFKLLFKGEVLVELWVPRGLLAATAKAPSARPDLIPTTPTSPKQALLDKEDLAVTGLVTERPHVEKASPAISQDQSTRGYSAMRSTIEQSPPPATMPEPAYCDKAAATSMPPLSSGRSWPDLVCADPATWDAAQTMVMMAEGLAPRIRPILPLSAGIEQIHTSVLDAVLYRARETP
ncbi:hypothetical protein LTR53_002085 [Teratosphaeriaceae sp. CCFEE 6253]|nr:hypothetical protein LTR53_002085 [Teratosphaeriaceae sp. CCFEE 6253]